MAYQVIGHEFILYDAPAHPLMVDEQGWEVVQTVARRDARSTNNVESDRVIFTHYVRRPGGRRPS